MPTTKKKTKKVAPFKDPKAYATRGEYKLDSRICFGIAFYSDAQDAADCAQAVRENGFTYNGGWFDGAPCGRETSRDYTDKDGRRWHAVTY